MVQGLELPGARQILLKEEQGLCDVGQMAVDQELLFVGVRVLVILTGYAEVEARHPAVFNSIIAALKKIKDNVHYEKIILGAPLPRPTATIGLLKDLFKMSKLLQFCCRNCNRLEFSKSGLLFYGPGGLYADLMQKTGLSTVGVLALKNQLVDKLNSLGCKRR